MSYATVEARVQTLLQGLTSVFSASGAVTRGDWQVLDRGYTHSAVLYPGTFDATDTQMGPGGQIYKWTVNVELFKKFTNTVYADFGAVRDSVIQQLMKYPTLNSLADTMLLPGMSGGDIREIFGKDTNSGPFFISQVIAVPVSNIVIVTLAE